MKAAQQKHRLIFIGNGGSATIASHQAVDYWKNGGIQAISFNASSLPASAMIAGFLKPNKLFSWVTFQMRDDSMFGNILSKLIRPTDKLDAKTYNTLSEVSS